MSLLAEMNQKALNLGLPISVHLDITYRYKKRQVYPLPGMGISRSRLQLKSEIPFLHTEAR